MGPSVGGNHGIPCVDIWTVDRVEDDICIVPINPIRFEDELDDAAGSESVTDEARCDGMGM